MVDVPDGHAVYIYPVTDALTSERRAAIAEQYEAAWDAEHAATEG